MIFHLSLLDHLALSGSNVVDFVTLLVHVSSPSPMV